MTPVFLSYSAKDHHFAELAASKLEEAAIIVWRDRGQLRAGSDWRTGIETGIADSIAVLVALSQNSVEASYVTFEWAYALGKGKAVIPIRLEACKVPLRLEPIHSLDFSVPGALPWNLLIERIREIETVATPAESLAASAATRRQARVDPVVTTILNYLDQRGFQMLSYDRVRKRINPTLTDVQLDALVADNLDIFRPAVLKDNKKGLAKQIP